jgi:hypothetical protein
MARQISAQDQVAVLAALMRAARPGEFSGISFFLGAGAPRGAGLPLADELKAKVAETVFGRNVPNQILEGRLEDVMELFHSLGGKNGYELVAQEIRKYRSQPRCYLLLADLINKHFVKIVLTTNFDLLLDELPAAIQVKLTIISSDEKHETEQIPYDSTIVSKLHGSANDPSTMRGSWTDGKNLPEERAKVLRKALKNFPTVFIGWAAQDSDILNVIREIASEATKQRIFWVDPSPSPSSHILEVLGLFDSAQNYISLTADDFFQILHDHLFPTNKQEIDISAFRQLAERIQLSNHAMGLEALRKVKEMREAYRQRVHGRVLGFLADLKNQIAPRQRMWSVGGYAFNIENIDAGDWKREVERLSRSDPESAHSALQIRTGGPALTLFVGNHYSDDGDKIELTAVLAYHNKSKPGTGAPFPPLTVWGGSEFIIDWGSEASFKEMEIWLDWDLKSIFLEGFKFFAELIQGKAYGIKPKILK